MIGKRFGYREHAHTLGDPLRPAEVTKMGPPRSRKVRVRWLDGEYEGLEEWVPKVRLVIQWEEADKLLADEQHVITAADACGDVYHTTEW
ncbi:MAG: hypothetical protein M1358_12255 [Chloroflexi bacterium]|nr:hypothetical protein [Chloroflexota bacterium]